MAVHHFVLPQLWRGFLVGERRAWHHHHRYTVQGYRGAALVAHPGHQGAALRRGALLVEALLSRGGYVWAQGDQTLLAPWGRAFVEWPPGRLTNMGGLDQGRRRPRRRPWSRPPRPSLPQGRPRWWGPRGGSIQGGRRRRTRRVRRRRPTSGGRVLRLGRHPLYPAGVVAGATTGAAREAPRLGLPFVGFTPVALPLAPWGVVWGGPPVGTALVAPLWLTAQTVLVLNAVYIRARQTEESLWSR